MSIPEQLHAAFTRLSGQRITLSAMRMEVLAEMARRGFTAEDVELVCRWVTQQIARGEGGYNTASLQFGAMLGRTVADVDKFEDKLEVARQSKLGRALAARSTPMPGAQAVPCAPLRPAISEAEAETLRAQRKQSIANLRKEIGR